MTPLTKWTVVAVCLTVLAALVPWARYGDTDVELSRLPLWWAYFGAAVVVHATAWLSRVVSTGAGAVALAAAVVVALGYDDAGAIFGDVVPLVNPLPGPGVVFAVASVAAQVAGAWARRPAPVA